MSYSHDSAEHQARVLGLADRLRADGVGAEVDQYNAAPPKGWPLWCEQQIKAADIVLMVCTETYYRRVSGDEKHGKGLGVVWEAQIIRQLLYEAGAVSDKFVPVLFSDTSPEQIPTPIKGWTHYVVDTEDGYENLYRRLTAQPRLLRPALGTIRPLPTRGRQWPADETPPAPPDWSPASVQSVRRKVVIPSEYLGWLTSRVLHHTGFLNNTTRDQLVDHVRNYLNTNVLMRSDEPHADLHFI